MIGKAPSSAIRPTALGIVFQQSVYGATIPVIYGRTRSQLYMIWAENVRRTKVNVGKKLGFWGSLFYGGKKKAETEEVYIEQADMMMGHNPISGVLQFWEDGQAPAFGLEKLPLNFQKSGYTPAGSITITDGNFYWVIGVTATVAYSVTFDDYGGSGSETLSGTYEVPLWNTWYQGPDPSRCRSADVWPYQYYWEPGSGNVISQMPPPMTSAATSINVYYAQLAPNAIPFYTKYQRDTDIPVSALGFDLETVLGDGPEYSGPINYGAQQILYPHYAGLGTRELNLGSSATVPTILPEVLGTWAVNPTGDADFADMIEDIFKQGQSQAGIGASIGSFSPIQRGLNCYNLPGVAQLVTAKNNVEAFANQPFPYALPVTKGNFLLAAYVTHSALSGGTVTFTDTMGNTWNNILPNNVGNGLSWAQAASTGADTVTAANTTYNWGEYLLEVAGADTFDASVTGAGDSISITTTGEQGYPELILVFGWGPNATSDPSLQLWNTEFVDEYEGLVCVSRIVYAPGTYTLALPFSASLLAGVALKNSQAPAYARPLGNILDSASLQQTRLQDRANGLWGSLVMDSQKKASDWLSDLSDAADACYVWSGFSLKVLPRSEVSIAGNGAIYTAPTASGPIANLTEADMVAGPNEAPVTVERKAQVDVPNLLQIQHPSRSFDYNDVLVSQPETAAIALYGPRKDSPRQLRCIQDPAIGRMVLGILVRKQNYLRNTYKFKLQAKWKLLEAWDLVTIPVASTMALPNPAQAGTGTIPVRLTRVEEDDNYNLDCEAEPFIYGLYAPITVTSDSPSVSQPGTGETPLAVNAPIIFEPVPRLAGQTNTEQLWICVSDADTSYGGCVVYLSTDGGNSYNAVGTIAGNAVMGITGGTIPNAPTLSQVAGGTLAATTYYVKVTYVNAAGEALPSAESDLAVSANNLLQVASPPAAGSYTGWNVYVGTTSGGETRQNASLLTLGTAWTEPSSGLISGAAPPASDTSADWPAASDPDTTNNLYVNLSESAGELSSYQTSDEDNFVYPCYVGGGVTDIPYELMAYATATLTNTSFYELMATGAGNHLRRAVFGAPQIGLGTDHPAGSNFVFAGAGAPGILKLQMDQNWVGKTLYFKLAQMNQYGGGAPSLASLTAYTYTPLGTVGTVNTNPQSYSLSPASPLTQPTSTTIHMAQVTATFPSNAVNYNARTFTIAAPTSPTTYDVTIYDPGQVGDEGSGTNLTAQCQTSNSLVGAAGYTYIGSIVAVAAGGGSSTGGGYTGGQPTSALMPSEQLTIGFVMNSGATGTNAGPELAASHAGTVSQCVIVTKASDASVALTIKIKQNGTDVFPADPTVAAGTGSGTISIFTALTSSPLTVNKGDVFTIDITSGTSSWQFTAQLET